MSEAIEAAARGIRKERVGVVVSDVQDKTIVVRVERRTAHPLYRKIVKVSKKFTAHDENNEAKKGDTVRIVEQVNKVFEVFGVCHYAVSESSA